MKKLKQVICIVICHSILLLTSSCSIKIGIPGKHVTYIDSTFHGEFSNYSHITKGFEGKPNFMDIFSIFHIRADNTMTDSEVTGTNVRISFPNSKHLLLTYIDSGIVRHKLLDGEFKKLGYFETYIDNINRRHGFPSANFPIITRGRNYNQIRIALSEGGYLVLDNQWEQSVSLFMVIGQGNDGRRVSLFKKLKD